jgi:FAD/FMN-containing dehydrogenase
MTPDAADAAAALGDRAVTPGDAAWDDARQAWNLSVDQRPALVARPRSADDVADVLIHAKACGLRVAPQGTGHNARPLGPLEDVALLKTDLMQGVAVDPAARRARVEAGALWGPIVDAAGEHGLAALAGSAADVGAVGYTLGGGLSWMARPWPATESSRSSSSPPTGAWCAPTPATSPSCSGRCAAGAAALAS